MTTFTRAPPVCAACGYAGRDLDVHLVCGGVGAGAACACPFAAVVRAGFDARVAAAFARHGASAALANASARSRARLALLLGGRGLPVALQLELPGVFAATFGRYYADERARRAAAPAP